MLTADADLLVTIHRRHRRKKMMMDQNFEIRILIFENFLKFSKRRRAVHPSAADLDDYGRDQTRSE